MLIGKFLSKRIRGQKLRILLFLCAFFCALNLGMVSLLGSTRDLPTFEEVKKTYKPSDVWIVDRSGYPLESIRTSHQERSLDWISLQEVSPSFQRTLIQAEDKRFQSHSGVDFLALGKATFERIKGNTTRGASTLSMQIVGLLEKKSAPKRRTSLSKLRQILLALKLETQWTKSQVLEAYLNLVPFRGELKGLQAASLGYFGKKASGLVDQESALLVSLIRSPNASVEIVAKRTCGVLRLVDCSATQDWVEKIVSRPYRLTRSRDLVPVLSDRMIENHSNPSVIQTSLDYRIQVLARTALREQLRELRDQNVRDGAVLVLETQTGRVVAYMANAGAGLSSAEQVDGIQTKRQAGSTMKPFVYGTAFDLKILRPNSLLEDSPADLAISKGRVYHPKNYDSIFRGFVGVGESLGSSLNVPAVRALQLVGESRVLDRLRSLGFENLEEDDYYGPSLALGAIDVTLWELTQAYRQLAVPNSTFSDSTRESLFQVLASPEYRRLTFGTDSLLTLPFAAAVKTGTSKDMRDNWCIGWTPDYTVGVWVGNFNGEPMWNVSGVSGAAPIWRNVMLALHPHREFLPLSYEEPERPLLQRSLSRIKYPAQDMLVGLDPDIPLPLQKLPIEIENPQKGHQIFLNGKLLSQSQDIVLWPVKRGKYKVDLKASSGKALDSVQFEVR